VPLTLWKVVLYASAALLVRDWTVFVTAPDTSDTELDTADSASSAAPEAACMNITTPCVDYTDPSAIHCLVD
jgi:hypothetical protein